MKNQPLVIIISLGLIICAGILPYAQTLSYPFHADSITHIVDNPNIRNPLKIKELWSAYPVPGRLVTFATFAMNYAVGGEDPAGYRAVNIALHTLNGLVLWLLVLMMFQTPRLITDDLNPRQYAVALFAGLIFLLHPLQTQAVTYVIQRSTLLATLFSLLTMLLYLRGRLAERGGWLMFGAAVCGLLAMFSKEIAFTLPLMLITMEFYLLKSGKYSSGATRSFSFKHLMVITLYLLIIPGLHGLDYESVLQTEVISRSHDAEAQILTPGGYFLTQYEVLMVYLQKIFLPLRLSFDYDMPAAPNFSNGVMWGLTVFVVMILAALILHGRSVLTTIGVLGFFILLAVESTIIPLGDLIQEHRLYLPLSFFTVAVVAWLYVSQKRAVVAHLICLVVAGALAYGTYQRNFVYQDRLTLWEDVAAQFPNKARAYVEMGKIQLERGELVAAMKSCREALRINRNSPQAHAALSQIYAKLGDRERARRHIAKAVAAQPGNDEFRYYQAMIFYTEGKPTEALNVLDQIIQSGRVSARVYYQRGLIREQTGDGLLALSDYNRAIKLNPYLTEAINKRALYYAEQKRYADAMLDFNRLLEIDPNSVLAYANRGLVLARMGDYKLALKDLDKAAAMQPEVGLVYANRGYVYELSGDAKRAHDDYQRAIELDPRDPIPHVQAAFLALRLRDTDMAGVHMDRAVMTGRDNGLTLFHRALIFYQTERYAEAYQDLMAASREGYAPADEFLPRVTPQLSAPQIQKP
ncbi:MAG: tetratricopeptide repeat protein [Candidatus Omnitrophica bacterium]|nr:tetratricopeptide repeat protein [Candidatus Omnitrophota bacterium]MCB9722318.1 tetratricopeptide repeat protein [Candidatus Omnitrophota bacterium]